MSEPQRLLQEGQEGDELTRSLLRSARDDAPAPHARQKTMIALGLAGGVGATVTAATATSTAATLAKGSAGVALLKWIGVGVLGGVVTVGAVAVVQSRNTPVTMGPQAAPNPGPASPAPIHAGVVEQPRATAEPAPSAAPIEEPTAKPVEAPKASAKPAEKASLADEVAALDAARVALASGNAAAALRALDDHDRRFPGGALGPEATVMRIEALALRGDRASAARLGRAFLDAHPRSPHASRIRSLIGAADDSPAP